MMVIARYDSGVRLQEIESEISVSRSALYRILGTLKSKNFIESPEQGVYRLGFSIYTLGLIARQYSEMDVVVRPILEKLVQETGETAMLTASVYPEAMCVAKCESHKPVRLSFEVGKRMPLCLGASAKILLCGLSDQELDKYLTEMRLSGVLAEWKVDEQRLRKQVSDAKQTGHLTTIAEVDKDAFGVAAVVNDHFGHCRYGLSIAGPTGRFDEKVFTDAVQQAALDLTDALFPNAES